MRTSGASPEGVRCSPAKLQLIGSERSNQAEDKSSKIHSIYTAKYVVLIELQYIKVNLSPPKINFVSLHLGWGEKYV